MASDDLDGTTTASLRLINARSVLRILAAEPGPHTLGALATASGLTRPTIVGALDELAARGLVIDIPPAEKHTGAGRPARRFRFLAEAGLAVGIDLRVDRIRMHVTDLAGRTVATSFARGLSLLRPREAVDTALDQLDRTLTDAGLGRDLLRSLSLSVPGVVDGRGTLWKSVVVPEWVDANLPQLMRDALGQQPIVTVENAANHAAQSETLVDDTAASSVFVLIDEGIGAGILLDGRLVRGVRGGAGEVGALEQLRWSQASETLLRRTGAPDLVSALDYSSNDPGTRRALEDFAEDIAIGTAALVLAYDPEVVVLGGIIALADHAFLELIRADLARLCLYPPTTVSATFGEDAVARGAAAQALADARRSLFP